MTLFDLLKIFNGTSYQHDFTFLPKYIILQWFRKSLVFQKLFPHRKNIPYLWVRFFLWKIVDLRLFWKAWYKFLRIVWKKWIHWFESPHIVLIYTTKNFLVFIFSFLVTMVTNLCFFFKILECQWHFLNWKSYRNLLLMFCFVYWNTF